MSTIEPRLKMRTVKSLSWGLQISSDELKTFRFPLGNCPICNNNSWVKQWYFKYWEACCSVCGTCIQLAGPERDIRKDDYFHALAEEYLSEAVKGRTKSEW
jgi:hypothetical protein